MADEFTDQVVEEFAKAVTAGRRAAVQEQVGVAVLAVVRGWHEGARAALRGLSDVDINAAAMNLWPTVGRA